MEKNVGQELVSAGAQTMKKHDSATMVVMTGLTMIRGLRWFASRVMLLLKAQRTASEAMPKEPAMRLSQISLQPGPNA